MRKYINMTPNGYAMGLRNLNSDDGLPSEDYLGNRDICAANESRFDPNVLDNGLTKFANTEWETAAANASKIVESTYQEPVKSYTVGWDDGADLDAALEFIAPPVQVSDRFEYKEGVAAEYFMSDASAEDLRAIGSEFARVMETSIDTTARTYNRGLTMRKDDDEVKNVLNWRERTVQRLTNRLKRNELRRAWALLVAAATNNAKTWDTTAGKDPDQDIVTARLAFVAAVAMAPNRCLISDGAWNKRSIALRAQNLMGQGNSSSKTPAELSQWLMTPVRIASERYSTSATARTLLGGSSEYVLLYLALSGATVDDPSNIKGFWSPCPNSGQRFAVYEERKGPKSTDITVEHYSLTKITSTLGIQSLTIS